MRGKPAWRLNALRIAMSLADRNLVSGVPSARSRRRGIPTRQVLGEHRAGAAARELAEPPGCFKVVVGAAETIVRGVGFRKGFLQKSDFAVGVSATRWRRLIVVSRLAGGRRAPRAGQSLEPSRPVGADKDNPATPAKAPGRRQTWPWPSRGRIRAVIKARECWPIPATARVSCPISHPHRTHHPSRAKASPDGCGRAMFHVKPAALGRSTDTATSAAPGESRGTLTGGHSI